MKILRMIISVGSFAIFWVIKSISSSKVSLKDRDKKSVLLDVGLVVISFVFSCFSVKYFFEKAHSRIEAMSFLSVFRFS